jgi:hypothetical protein
MTAVTARKTARASVGPSFVDTGDFTVARALRVTAERDGAELVRALHAAYEELNMRHFGGKLPPAAILVTRTQSPRALGDHIPIDENGIRFRVRISPVTLGRGLLFALDVLLHEMVHIAQSHLEGTREPGYQGHGPIFARLCNDIGAELGLPEVFARGTRAGKPDCAQWPVNVRPRGFYGPEHEEREAPKRTKGERQEEDEDASDREEREARAVVIEKAARKAIVLLERGKADGALAVLRAAVE